MKVIVVGTNHAGTIASRALKQLNPSCEVVTYDKNDNISFLGCGIALWVKGEFDDPEGLFYANPKLLTHEGVKVNMNHDVVAFNPQKHEISIQDLQSKRTFTDNYDKIIFALGSWPIIPPIPGINLQGVQIVKWYQHGQKVKQFNQDNRIKRIAVCGAGYIGVELVDAFAANNKEVLLFDICDRVMPNYYDEEFTKLVEVAMRQGGVQLHLGERVLRFNGDANQKLSSVTTDRGEYSVDLVIWTVGFSPATKILEGKITLSDRKAIKVNRQMQTSDPDVYAIGDCIEVYENPKEDNAYIALATTAIRTGVIAAMNIAQKKTVSPGFQGSNAICIFGWSLSGTGLSEVACQKLNIAYDQVLIEDYDRPEFMHEKYKVWFKIIWNKKNRQVIGAQIASRHNHTEVMYMLSLAIKQKMKIDELALTDIFFLPHFNKPFNFITKAGLKAIGLSFPESRPVV